MLPEPPITYLDDGVNWRLDSEIVATSGDWTLIVPPGRTSDLASVPKLFWNLEAPFQLSIVAAYVHDEGYRHGGRIAVRVQGPTTVSDRVHVFSRAEIDGFLYDLAIQRGVPKWKARAAYYAVRWFGASSWQP